MSTALLDVYQTRHELTLTASSSNSIATLQSLGSAGNLTLNGSLTSDGVYTTSDLVNKQITANTTGNATGVTLTISGYLEKHQQAIFTETLALGNATANTTTNYFYKVTNISSNGAVANVTVGTAASGAIIIKNNFGYDASTTIIDATISGTANITAQTTLDPIYEFGTTGTTLSESNVGWVNDGTLASITSGTTRTTLTTRVGGLRLKFNSYSSTPTVIVRTQTTLTDK